MGRAHRIVLTLAADTLVAAALVAASPARPLAAGVPDRAPAASRSPSSAPAVIAPASGRGAYSVQTWRTDEGLPSDVVNDIEQDAQGYLWIATNSGLARFDGLRFEVYDRARVPALEGDDVGSLLVTRAGRLWIGSVGGGLTSLDGGTFTGHGRARGLAFQYSLRWLEDRDGRVWSGTNEALYLWEAAAFRPVGRRLQPVLQDASGRIWFAGSDGLAVWENGAIVPVARPPFVPEGARWPYRVVPGHAGTIWINELTTGRLARTRDGVTSWITLPARLRDAGVRAFFESADGTLWMGTPNAGLHYLENGVFHDLIDTGELPARTINAIVQDREGNLWVGTEDGLSRLRRRAFAMVGREAGLTDERAWAVLEDRSGDLWITTERTLERVRASRVTTYTHRDGLAGPSGVTSLAEDARGRLCIGTTVGLSCREGDRFLNYGEEDGLSEKNVRALFEDRKGRLWIGTGGGGVSVLENGRFRAYRAKDGLGSDWVRFITEDAKGDLWLGTTGGLSRWSEGRITTWRTADGLADDLVLAIQCDVDGSLWIGTFGGGLSRFKNGVFRTLTTSDGLLDNTILRILDSGGDLWMSTPRGIFRVERRELHAVADGARAHLTSVVYGKRDGLATTDCGGGTQPAGWKGRDGRLYFPTSRGVAVVDPAGIAANRVVPPVVIEEVLSDGQGASTSGGAVLRAGARRLEIRYTALSLSAPEKVRFRYRLEGFDPDWVDAGTRRVATYTALPPRVYRFQVRAANDDGLWNDTGASIAVHARPFFYQTWAFLAGCALLAAAAAWAAYRLRMRQIESRFAAVLDERVRIARELHDTIARGFTGVSMQLEAVAARLPHLPREARESLDRARLLIRSSLADARRSVRAMRPRSLETGDLSTSLRAMVEEATAGTAVRGTFAARGAGRPLPPLVEDHLLRVGQEALSNALKHGGCREVRIELSYQRGRVELAVADDGRGIASADTENGASRGMGLSGMRERLAQVGGHLEVTSRAGEGTTVRAVAPLPGLGLLRRAPKPPSSPPS